MTNRRTALYVGTLVYMDGPQVIHLRAHKTHVIAMAIPSSESEMLFIAATVTAKNWSSYMDGHVDLRYLYTYANVRTIYYFDLFKMKDSKITMLPWKDELTEDVLPSPRFFSVNHTEEDQEEVVSDTEVLQVDGEWDMPDFGNFYSRYADVYYFLSSANEYEDVNTPLELKAGIEDAFKDKAFRGGFSYVHFYEGLAKNRGRSQRLNIDKIKYESPGYINVNGEKEAFSETKNAIIRFLESRKAAKEAYERLYAYLSKARLLPLEGHNYQETHPTQRFIRQYALTLAETVNIPNTDAIDNLVSGNTLVFAKVIMSFYRRINEASKFFAQGRVNFT